MPHRSQSWTEPEAANLNRFEAGTKILPDPHLANIEQHRKLRRLAGELLADYLPMSKEHRALIFADARRLVRLNSGLPDRCPKKGLAREAAQLYSRIPDDPNDAMKTIEILEKLLVFIEDGVIDLREPASPVKVIEDVLVKPHGHLQLVSGND